MALPLAERGTTECCHPFICPNPVISVHRKLAETPIFVSLPFSALTLLVGQQEGHPACRKAGRWLVGSHHLTGDLRILQLQLSPPTPSSLAPIKYILVPANPGPTGKWPLKWRERESRPGMCSWYAIFGQKDQRSMLCKSVEIFNRHQFAADMLTAETFPIRSKTNFQFGFPYCVKGRGYF